MPYSRLSKVNHTHPNYWPTTAEFISYRSENLSPQLADEFAATRNKLPRCTDKPPSPPQVLSVPSPTKFTSTGAIYQDCKVQLDDPTDEDRINKALEQESLFVTFRRSLVEYHGGPITIHLLRDLHNPSRPISTLGFEDCIFDFSVVGTPSAEGQTVLLALLLNTSGDIYLPGGATVTPIQPPAPH